MDAGDEINGEMTPLQALERFVVDNDELLELEECIGRFNIFDALGVARREVKHSDFLVAGVPDALRPIFDEWNAARRLP